ncbi:MAG: type II toxin-antitoxin system PemK/MazF family toxin [Verrucomicrobiota bacterium]|nr:type II toxin-antitoxin system PemK/MazF family toxin [Verrucomicrobiota bacterium]
MNAWDIFEADLGWGVNPVVIVSHPVRAARKDFVEVLDCSSRRAMRPPHPNEILLDEADGLDWQTFCKCDLIIAVPRAELKRRRDSVGVERRRQIVRTVIATHGWNAL